MEEKKSEQGKNKEIIPGEQVEKIHALDSRAGRPSTHEQIKLFSPHTAQVELSAAFGTRTRWLTRDRVRSLHLHSQLGKIDHQLRYKQNLTPLFVDSP